MGRLIERLDHKPNELGFGTSGLRGLLSDMTDLECYINTAGFIEFLKQYDKVPKKVYLAGDLRSSTPRIMKAVAAAIQDAGLDYENCGLVPTPAVALWALKNDSPCIMVTGSHIPDDRNGIKFYRSDGEVLKADEPLIKDCVAKLRAQIYDSESKNFANDGSLVESLELQPVVTDAQGHYKERYLDFFGDDSLSGTKLVMYQHSAVGRDLIPEILSALGAEVVCVDRSEKFVPIDTENVTPDDSARFERIAGEHPDCFAIVSTDGDSDRPFVIDERGVFNRGDVLGVVVSRFLESSAVALPISSNDATIQFFKDNNINYVTTKIGSPYVIAAMQELASSNTNVTGWEVNGGFMVGEDVVVAGKTLSALPTRDALLPIVCAVVMAKQNRQKLSELFASLPQRFTQAGLIDNFPTDASAMIISALAKDDAQAHQTIAECFRLEDGFEMVEWINPTDGVRIRFENGDVAHLRPSGNAPQLRIYSNADTQERANEIVALAIAEPDGILRQLEKKFL